MLENFVSSWPLFHNTYLAGWLIALLLSVLGVWIVAKDQIFIGAAIAQSSTFGIALGLWFSSLFPERSHFFLRDGEQGLSVLAVIFSMVAALLTARGGGKGNASHESITGWVFLFSAAMAILLVSHSPHGLEEVHRLLSSSIIGASAYDVGIFALLALVTTFSFFFWQRKILLYILDVEMATAVGMRVKVWSFASALWLGLTIGLALRVSGMLYTFGCLVLPALAAKYFCREVKQLFLLAPLVALVISAISFVLANHYDFPPAPMTVALLGAFTLAAAGGQILWRSIKTI